MTAHEVAAAREAALQDAEMLQLVAMALAGYPHPHGPGARYDASTLDGDSHQESVTALWRDMCEGLRVRMGRRHPYLRAVCAFLHAHSVSASTGGAGGTHGSDHEGEAADDDGALRSPDGSPWAAPLLLWRKSPYRLVLAEMGVALSDRVAFACRFLPDDEVLTDWVCVAPAT